MNDLLSNLLDDIASPEIKVTIMEACEIFDELEHTDHQTPIEMAIMSTDNDDSGETFTRIYRIIKENVIDLLRQHAIYVSADVERIDELVVILGAVTKLEYTEQDEMILDICDSDWCPEEKLAEIIHTTTGVSSDEILLCLSGVDPKLITLIREIAKKVGDKNKEPGIPPKDVEKKKFKLEKLYENEIIKPVDEALTSGLRLGMAFEEYVELLGVFEKNYEDKVLAKVLLGLSIISQDNDSNPSEKILPMLNKMLADPARVGRVMSLIAHDFVYINNPIALTVSASN